MTAPTDPRPAHRPPPDDPRGAPIAADVDPAERAEILGRVLAGDVTDREACALLGLRPTALARWKLQALEAIERFDPEAAPATEELAPAAAPATEEPAAAGASPAVELAPVPDEVAEVPPAPSRSVVDARLLVVAGIGVLAFAVIAVLLAPVASLTTLGALNRWAAYASGLLAVGGAVFLVGIHDRRGTDLERDTLRWWIRAGAVAGVVTTLLTLGFQGAVLAGTGPFRLLDPRVAAQAAEGSLGISVALRLLGLAYLLYAATSLTTRRTSRVVAVVGGALVLVSFLVVGHSATSQPRALVAVANLVHTGAAAVWFGGLVLLAITLRHRRRARDLSGAATVVLRFSRSAMVAVGLVVLAGTALAVVELPRVSTLVSSAYGLMILAKLTIVGVLLLVARENHRRIVPDLAAQRPRAWGQLRRTVGVEIGGIVLILLATGLLVSLPPPQ